MLQILLDFRFGGLEVMLDLAREIRASKYYSKNAYSEICFGVNTN